MSIQGLLHKMEEGSGKKYVQIALIALAVVFLLVTYNWRGFRNMDTQEAMDTAQLARNLAQGEGYTTDFIRPLSIYLLQEHNKEDGSQDPARLKTGHPDLANPPVYPVILAGLMKVLPFQYTPSRTAPFFSTEGRFWRYQPDFLITLFNQLLLLCLVALTIRLGIRLFDARIGYTAGVFLLVSELLWRFSASGLSTMFLMLLFLSAAWLLVLWEQELREPSKPARLVWIPIALGLLIGVGALTRYSFGFLIIPVVVFLVVLGGGIRWVAGGTAVALFFLILTPWVFRNVTVSGTLFGTAGYAIFETTGKFYGNTLQRSLDPEIKGTKVRPFIHKILGNLRPIVHEELPKLGGSYLSAFFLVGLLLRFRNPILKRLKYFTLGSLGLLILVQALGRTHLSEASPMINSENLLILLAPLVVLYGAGCFYVLLDQLALRSRVRYLIVGALGILVALPMILVFLPPRTSPIAFPPYFPPALQAVSSLIKTNELAMSDMPWAIAWYGDRQAVWTTLDTKDSFYAISDYLKPVSMLHLSPLTMNEEFSSNFLKGSDTSWPKFALETLIRKSPPPYFPLKKAMPGVMPDQMVLYDWERWRLKDKEAGPPAPPSEESDAR